MSNPAHLSVSLETTADLTDEEIGQFCQSLQDLMEIFHITEVEAIQANLELTSARPESAA